MKTPQKSRSQKTPEPANESGEETTPRTKESKWHLPSKAMKPLEPGLYVTATPIGNLRDISLRALDVLAGADVVLCEDTRVTGKLLAAYGIRAELKPYHDHNGERVRPAILKDLAAGRRIALVSDAGTPLISDPGFRLVGAARDAGHPVFVVPGPSSVAAAISIAGLPSDRFFFGGFLPPKQAARRTALSELARVRGSLVVLESPGRLAALLADAASVLGPREAAIARELTKLHEELRRGTLADLAAQIADEGPPKGEIVVVIAPPTDELGSGIDIDAALRDALAHGSVKDAAATVAEMTGRPRKELYARALELQKS